jgi:hypothetical protein
MRTLAIALLAALSLTGCAKYSVSRPDTSLQQASADSDACFYDAKKAVAGASNPLIARSQARSLTLQCMQLKGYSVRKG